jgi:hypothetical protein
VLELFDRRVFAVDIVADVGVGHRLTHRLRRAGHGVGAQVDDRHAPSLAADRGVRRC